MTQGPHFKLGDIVNGHVLTNRGWVRLQMAPMPPAHYGPTRPPSGGIPGWIWALIAVCGGVLFVVFLIVLGAMGQQAKEEAEAEAEVACVRWNAEWAAAVAADDDFDPLFESQPEGCDVASETLVYNLWHSTWESKKAIEGWPQCEKTLVTGAPVTQKNRDLGCADGFSKVEPEVTECTDGTTLVAIDDTGLFTAGLSAYGFVGETFTAVGDKPYTADAGYADALEKCVG